MQIKVFKSFEDARSTWIDFQKEADFYAFQSIEWATKWYTTIGITLKLQLCFVHLMDENGKSLMFLPWAIKRKNAISYLIWIGEHFADYQAPVLCKNFYNETKQIDFVEIWASIISKLPHFDAMHFKAIPEIIGSQRNPLLSLNLKHHLENSYSTLIDRSWNEFYSQKVKKRIRSDSRRQLKRLSKLGHIKFIISSNSSEATTIVDALISQRRSLCRETGRRDMFRCKSVRDFYCQSAIARNDKGFVQVAALQLDDQLLATHWGIVLGKRFYYLMPSYEGGSWKTYSTGRLLLEYLLEWAFNNQLECFDFTVGGEQYKNDWCNQEMKLYELICAMNCKGKLYLTIQGIFSVLKRFNVYTKSQSTLSKPVRKIKKILRGYY